MKRSTRAEAAKETLHIIETGNYQTGGKTVDVSAQLQRSLEESRLYRPQDFSSIEETVEQNLRELDIATRISALNCTVLEAALSMTQTEGAVGCLNFASAKNPGGGFLNGAQAQEESLAVSSTLYASQLRHFTLYEYNRARSTFLYSDHCIWSPEVSVFRDDSGALLQDPCSLSIITSPAVNVGAMLTHNRTDELAQVEESMLRRMERVLSIFVHHGIRRILLGAWGCGVFRNEAADVARWFAHFLLPGGKFSRCFEEVVFAVYDRSKDGNNINAFKAHFEPSYEHTAADPGLR